MWNTKKIQKGTAPTATILSGLYTEKTLLPSELHANILNYLMWIKLIVNIFYIKYQFKATLENRSWESSLKTGCEWHRNACGIFVSVIYYLY